MTRASCISHFMAAVVLSSFVGAAQNSGKVRWPQFRGPNSAGLGEGKPPVKFGPDQNVLWKTAVGSGLSSPIIWEGRIFLTEFDATNKQLATLCIDRRTGKVVWRRAVAPEQIEKVHEISSRSHACHRRRAGLCLLRILRAGVLRPEWKYEMGKAIPFAR
jgi:hypothetical protein